ncbi:unnamed protein product [Haemonchus placei]|uniref:Cytochrome c oxidase polypeptide VIIc n=1 Tax=Haemonchus placei TaxID=6290 RepID=A0A0N4W0X3_HAEPC|nr:unnamed protein product [Haemonchus placei]
MPQNTTRISHFLSYLTLRYIKKTQEMVKLSNYTFQRTPFSVTNKWLFATKAIVILTVGFWAPFIVVEYQLRKANQ